MFKVLKKILLLFFVFVNLNVGQDSTWQVIGEMKYPVSGSRAVVKDSLIYIIGGYSDSLQANVDWIQRFNPFTNEWTITARMMEKRYGFFAGINDDKLYIYGGINEVNENAFVLEEWDFESPSTNTYSTNELFDRVFSTGTIFNNKLVMIGGYAASRGSSADLPYITGYDFGTDIISTIDDTTYLSNELPIQQLSVRVDDKLYLLGGVFNGVLQNFDVINLNGYYEMNYENRIISPRAAGEAVYCSYSDKIYLIGGYNEVSPAIATTETIVDFDTNPVVSPAMPLNYPRRNLSAVEFYNRIYIFGGENESGEVIRYVEQIAVGPVSVIEDEELKSEFQLHQNYPNPFNPETNISFSLKSGTEISIEIYNSLGEKIDELFNGYSHSGTHTLKWNGTDSEGEDVPTGIYFYRLSSNQNFVTKKMLLLK